jgi:hypothetical protein
MTRHDICLKRANRNKMTKFKINELYSRYFQKSMVFLFPLSGLPFHKEIKPKKSYLKLKGLVDFETSEFILEFDRNEDVLNYLNPELARNSNLTLIKSFSRSIFIHVNLSNYCEDYTSFIKGKYSQMNTKVKKIILDYHSFNKANQGYIHSFLYPDLYFEDYAKLLDVPVDLLRQVGELIDRPNLNLECFDVPDLITHNTELGMTLTYLPNL